MTTLFLATGNAHKIAEIRAILSERFRYFTLGDFPAAPKTVEDAATFAGNATKKAVELANWLSRVPPAAFPKIPSGCDPENFLVLADDSGLEVDALNGAPGVYSARFAALDSGEKGNSSDAANNLKLMRLLEKVPAERRTARFRCAIALAPAVAGAPEDNSKVGLTNERKLRLEVFEGICEGRIALAQSGHGGFGYDPLFVPEGFGRSFAELGDFEKNKISHRAQALEKLRKRLSVTFGLDSASG